MTAVTEGSETHPTPGGGHPSPEPAPAAPATPASDAFASPVPVANAALVGVPTFLAGSIALGLVFLGFVPQTLAGAPIATIAMTTGLGLATATVFALKAGESAVASVFGIFAGFWLSYATLVFGILHNWYGFNVVPASTNDVDVNAAIAATGANVVAAQKLFLLTWIIVVSLLVLVSLRLPLAFSALFLLVDIALIFVYIGVVNASPTATKTAGGIVMAFCAIGAYLFLDAMSAATGGKNLPLGSPVLK